MTGASDGPSVPGCPSPQEYLGVIAAVAAATTQKGDLEKMMLLLSLPMPKQLWHHQQAHKLWLRHLDEIPLKELDREEAVIEKSAVSVCIRGSDPIVHLSLMMDVLLTMFSMNRC